MSKGALWATSTVPRRNSTSAGRTASIGSRSATRWSVIPVTVLTAGGMGRPGFTSVANSPSTSPARALTTPTSVIRSPAGSSPVVSRSRTANVTSNNGVDRSSKLGWVAVSTARRLRIGNEHLFVSMSSRRVRPRLSGDQSRHWWIASVSTVGAIMRVPETRTILVATHRTTDELEAGLPHVLASPRDDGRLELIVVRPTEGQRRTPASVRCTIDGGVEGDDWIRRGSRHTPDGTANVDQQITVINARYLDLVAGSRDRWPLAGDQFVVDLDLSDEALAAGDRLRIGDVLVEVTPHPHRGCDKFRDRFGIDAVRFANSPLGRRYHLRGIHVRVIEEGTVRVGDRIRREPVERVAATA